MASRPLLIAVLISQILLCYAHTLPEGSPLYSREQSSKSLLNCKLVPSPPKKSLCGVRGTLQTQDTYKYDSRNNQTLPSLEKCRDYCLGWFPDSGFPAFQYCKGFSYNSTSNFCIMHSAAISNFPKGSFVKDPSSDTTFYDAECYSCKRVCPEPGLNLLHNGDFEDSSEYVGPWYPGSGYFGEDATGKAVQPGYNSTNAFGCEDGDCAALQVFRTCPSTHFLFSTAIKLVYNSTKNPNPGPPDLSCSLYTNYQSTQYEGPLDKNFLQTPHIFAINSWQRFSGSFFSDFSSDSIYAGDGSVGLSFSTPKDGDGEPIFKAYFDEISVIPIPKTPARKGPNLLENGGFETGKLAPWVFEYSRPNHFNGTHKVLANASLSEGSKYGFFFQDRLKDQGYNYHTGVAGFRLSNKLPPTDPNKLYVVNFNWRANLTETTDLSVGPMIFPIHYDSEGESTLNGKRVLHTSRVFRGSLDPLKITITIEGSDYFSPKEYPAAYVDDVSVHEAVF